MGFGCYCRKGSIADVNELGSLITLFRPIGHEEVASGAMHSELLLYFALRSAETRKEREVSVGTQYIEGD